MADAAALGTSDPDELRSIRAAIDAGDDPLGERLCAVWAPEDRRGLGAFYTGAELVGPMLDWTLARSPARVIDPGCGSGRFAVGVARRARDLALVAIDIDPLATLLTRAALAVVGASAATVLQADYTGTRLPLVAGRSAYVGNPPYVRHHQLSPAAKTWAVAAGRRLGQPVSALAGLHAHFYLATALAMQPGDVGCFVTSAEWLNVNYGAAIRGLLLNGLGGQALHVIDPRAIAFADAMTTAVVTCFEAGAQPDALLLRSVSEPANLRDLDAGTPVPRTRLAATGRWSPLFADAPQLDEPSGFVPLRSLARVHRGVVTGANDFFIMPRARAAELGLERWCRPAVTSAREVLEANGVLRDTSAQQLLLDIPADIDRAVFPQLDAYLARGEVADGDTPPIATRYIASRRRPWWRLGTPASPPIVASYMARQAPAFALNPDGLAIVNIAHGIYPTRELTNAQLTRLVDWLNGARAAFRGSGRTYHGGLEKFEPREMEQLRVPSAVVD